MDRNIIGYIENAKQVIVELICGNNLELGRELLSYFNNVVEISFDGISDNVNFGAHTAGALKYEFKNGDLLVKSSEISIRLPMPPNQNSPQFNGWMVDVHHELFHAFTKLINGIKKCENEGDLYYAPSGGKISIMKYNNGTLNNCGDVPCSVLFNELITDLIAYASTYKSIDGIIYGDDLATIDERFGHYNGYFELLQLGLVIFNGFSNYSPNYDYMANKGIFEGKYTNKIDGEYCYYNDLLYGVMYNPMHIKTQFLKYCSEDEWEQLNEASKLILYDFQNRGRIINKECVKKIMELIGKYFENKMNSLENNLDSEITDIIRRKFNERFEYAKNYYNVQPEYNNNSSMGMRG